MTRPRRSTPPPYLLDGRYLATESIGHGEMSEVFAGTDTWSGESVAVRCLRPDRLELARAFRRKSERLFGYTSARVVRALHAGDDPAGRPYLVTERLVGRGAEQLGKVRWEVACELVRHGALALSELHLNGLHHGAIKTSTLFVASSADCGVRVKLLDLGQGERGITAANDRCALAKALHVMLTGNAAEEGDFLRLPDAPPELAWDLERWLEAGEDGATLSEMAAALRALVDPSEEHSPSHPIGELLVFPKSSGRLG
jgi:serine/threonine protein kinase